mgnify:CR=1 FL=1
MRLEPLREDLTIHQGATFQPYWVVRDENGDPVDLLTWDARAQFWRDFGDDTPELDLSVSGGEIVLDADGVVALNVPATKTESMTHTTRDDMPHRYDIELIEPGGEPVHKAVWGYATVIREATIDYE